MSILDRTRRARTEQALRESEQRMRAIWETAVEGIITIDERGCIESLNPAAARIFGYSPEEIVGRNVSVLMPSPDREKHDGYIGNYLRTGQAKIIGIGREVVGLRKNGKTFPMDLSVCEVRLGTGRIFTGFVRDISERRELEQAVAAAGEKERARIARELHDGLGQQLGGLLFLMEGFCHDLQSARVPQAETARQLCQELGTAMKQARHLAHALYAVPPTPEGLVEALGDLAERVASERRMACVFAGDKSLLVQNPAAAGHLYRIAQEAVNNALKHSGATRVEIQLVRSPASLELSVRDNGRGFSGDVGQASSLTVHGASVPRDSGGKMPPEPADRMSAPRRGLGLRTMEQRARLMGGRLLIGRGAVGTGAEVICSLPCGVADRPPTS